MHREIARDEGPLQYSPARLGGLPTKDIACGTGRYRTVEPVENFPFGWKWNGRYPARDI
jgi:hypothetical protein